ncbi:MAG: hypothetical protein RLO50_00335 [Azospirillaceae bacterium]
MNGMARRLALGAGAALLIAGGLALWAQWGVEVLLAQAILNCF